VLDILQNGTDQLPPFNLVVTKPIYYAQPVAVVPNEEDNFNDVARFKEGQVIVLADQKPNDVSLTGCFAQLYDKYRERKSISAKDLFGNYSRDDRENCRAEVEQATPYLKPE
jgi:hypothetical protein